jgi:hypothetical protein
MSAAALLTAASVLIAPSAYRAEVSRLFVAPSWRNRGVGGQLLAATVAASRAFLKPPQLEVVEHRADTVDFYQRRGGTSSTDDQLLEVRCPRARRRIARISLGGRPPKVSTGRLSGILDGVQWSTGAALVRLHNKTDQPRPAGGNPPVTDPRQRAAGP